MKKIYTTIILFIAIVINIKAQTPDWASALSYGGSSYDGGNCISTDANHNKYVIGEFLSATITFGSTTLTNLGSGDIFIVKYDVNENIIWAKSMGGAGSDFCSNIAFDVNGNFEITGSFMSPSIDFGGFILNNTVALGGSEDIFIAKYDSNGNCIWAKSSGGTSIDRAVGIAIDNSGNSYITGSYYSSNITFGTNTLVNDSTGGGTTDLFFVKYDVNGDVVWAKNIGGIYSDDLGTVKLDASGNVYICGSFTSPAITLGTTVLTNAGNEIEASAFVAKYDSNGNLIWAKNTLTVTDGRPLKIAVDNIGNSVITGFVSSSSSNSITFGTTTLNLTAGLGDQDLFIVKYDSNGNVLWAKSAQGNKPDLGLDIVLDALGNEYITGYFLSATLTFDNVTLTNPDNSGSGKDLFIAKYNSNGNLIWAKAGAGHSMSKAIAIDTYNNLYLTGYFTDATLAFGSTTLTNNGVYNAFVAKIDSSQMMLTTGVENIINQELTIYPNPSSHQFYISSASQINEVKLFNVMSELIYQSNHSNQQSIIAIDLIGQPKGIYFVQITDSNKKIMTKKIMIQ